MHVDFGKKEMGLDTPACSLLALAPQTPGNPELQDRTNIYMCCEGAGMALSQDEVLPDAVQGLKA